jgi:hypothetical protein
MISTRLAGVLLQKSQCPSLVLHAISAARLVDIAPLESIKLSCPGSSLLQENSSRDIVQSWSRAKGSDANRGGSSSHDCNALPLCLSQGPASRAQQFVCLPARIGLSAPSRSFSSAGSRAFAESAHAPSKAQPVSWRDFEDIGVWSIDEEPLPSAAGERTRGESKTSSTPPFASGGFVDSRAETAPGERKANSVTTLQLKTSNGGFLREESGEGGEELDSSSSRSKASGARLGGDSQESGDQSVTWRDFEDLGSWVVDEAGRNKAEENPTKRSASQQNRAKASSDSVTAALQSKTPPAKSKKKSKQREMVYIEGSLIQLPKPKGPPLTDEEMALSFFDLCQLPSLRGVENVDDFLKLSDEDLLRQCEVGTARGSGKGGQKRNKTESKVQLRHIPTGLTAASDKTRSQHVNKKKALEALQEKIALKGRTAKQRSGTQVRDSHAVTPAPVICQTDSAGC